MTKFIACDENSMKEFESFDDAVAFAKNMGKTAAVYMQAGTICARVWEATHTGGKNENTDA